MANEVTIVVKGKDETGAAFDSAKRGAAGLKGALTDVGKTAAGFLTANVIGAGVSAFKSQIGSVFSEAREAIAIGKQTEAVIKSTGGVAGVSAKSVSDLADSLSRVTNFEDDAIAGAENLLLTFTSIGKDVFPEATETVLNMSQALGQDLKSSAIQLGKAMNDPITGATALRRVGVALTEQQMEQIKAFQESGDILSAQKIIMKELATEFGGSARATADPLKILGNTIGELKEQIGLALLPAGLAFARLMSQQVVPAVAAGIRHFGNFIALIKASLAGDLTKAATLFNALPAPLQKLALVLADNKDSIIGFLEGVRDAAKGFIQFEIALAKWLDSSGLLDTALVGIKTIGEGIRATFEVLAPIVARVTQFFKDHKSAAVALGIALGVIAIALFPIPAAIIGVILAVGLLRKNWDEIKAKTVEVWESIPGPIKDALELIVRTVQFAFEDIKNTVETLIAVVSGIFKTAKAIWNGDWSEAWEGIKQTALAIWDGFRDAIVLRLGFLRDAFSIAWSAIDGIVGRVWSGMKTAAVDALNWIIGKINSVIGSINSIGGALSKIGIDAPDIPQIPSVGGVGAPLPPGTQIDPSGIQVPKFHGGTPYVPRDGTYYLERGEAVVPASQNRRGGDQISIDIDVHVNGDATNATVDLIRRAVREESEAALREAMFRGSFVTSGAFAPS